MSKFQIQTRVLIGDTVKNQLLQLETGRTLFVCDPFICKSGVYETLQQALENSGAVCACFSDIQPDPSIEIVSQGEKQIMAFGPDTVVAIGGGSAIDTAKLMTHIYRQAKSGAAVRLVAVPTTSGTGTEMTAFSIVTDMEQHVKHTLVDDAMLPDVAILDAGLLRTLPPAIMADTGMDALTHALEAYVAKDANDFTDALAEKTIRLVFAYLPLAVREDSGLREREKMLHASCLAGSAFNSAGLGLNHAMAHALGARFHLSHGRSNALLLPHVLQFNAEDAPTAERYRCIAELLHLPTANVRIAAASLIRHVEALRKTVNIGARIESCGIEKSEYLGALEEMAHMAKQDRCLVANPAACSEADMVQLYQKLL